MIASHLIKAGPQTCHWGYFDASLKPVLTIDPGDSVTITTVNGGSAEIANCPYDVLVEHREILAALSPKFGGHIMTGPVAVRGAKPGDVLEVFIEDIQLTTDWGWNTCRPLRGTLPEDFPYQHLLHIPLDRTRSEAVMPWGGRIPLRPFFGIMGVAPRPVFGAISSIEPREHGGNMDNKELTPGTSVYFPVFADGALFSAGDGHGVQGDGEVNLTGLETCLAGTFRFYLHHGRSIARPMALTPRHLITMGFDPDLDDAAKIALRDMIAELVRSQGWPAADAYAFCSMACDLHVTQLVDGNKGVHAMVERALLAGQH